jgi:hypothetical protein
MNIEHWERVAMQHEQVVHERYAMFRRLATQCLRLGIVSFRDGEYRAEFGTGLPRKERQIAVELIKLQSIIHRMGKLLLELHWAIDQAKEKEHQ